MSYRWFIHDVVLKSDCHVDRVFVWTLGTFIYFMCCMHSWLYKSIFLKHFCCSYVILLESCLLSEKEEKERESWRFMNRKGYWFSSFLSSLLFVVVMSRDSLISAGKRSSRPPRLFHVRTHDDKGTDKRRKQTIIRNDIATTAPTTTDVH